jgi:hypothetical protein
MSPRGQDRDAVARELAELEEERRRELNDAVRELQRELRDVRQESAETRDRTAELLEKHYEKLAELERRFADKRGELLHGEPMGREAEGRWSRRSEVLRELGKLEAERDRELGRIDAELERELRTARDEASREGKPEKYRDKARRLRAKHFEKVSHVEHNFAEKRARVLRK